MPQIKHIAIATNDAEKTAKFYSEVFGLRQVAQLDGENAKGFMLSDGNVNMAILDFKNDTVAGERGKDWEGIHHIGFEVEDLEDIEKRLMENNSKPMDAVNNALHAGMGGPRTEERRDQVRGPQRRDDRRLRNRLGRDPRPGLNPHSPTAHNLGAGFKPAPTRSRIVEVEAYRRFSPT